MTAPLRVTAVVAAADLGGTERVLLDFANRAFEFDIELKVLAPRDGPLVRILNEIGVPAEVVPAPAAMLKGSQRGVGVWRVPLALLGVARWALRLRKHAFFRDADVVFTQGYKPHLAIALTGRHPLVWHLHEFPPARTGWFWKWLRRRNATATIANSAAVGAAWGHATVVPNGVNLDRFTPRAPTKWIHDQLGIAPGHRLVGMPAVFARWKGQLEVIQAFRQIAAEFPAVHLVLVGGSIYDTVAEREYGRELRMALGARGAPAAGATSRIHLLDFQSKIETVYPELDLAVHYSLRAEPFGRVIVEAMACGVPVIAAAEGGPLEILGAGGWLVEPRNPSALAATLREALSLPGEELRSIGAAGRRRAEDHYSARRFAREVAQALNAVSHASPCNSAF